MSGHDDEQTGGRDAAPERRPDSGQDAQAAAAAPAPYALAGEAFTSWFNSRVSRLPNPTVMLGTKRARVLELHPDGRLEVEVETEAAEPELQSVSFEASYLDQLLRELVAQGASGR